MDFTDFDFPVRVNTGMLALKRRYTDMNASKNLTTQKWRDETALERFRMIAPLLDESLDPAKRIRVRREIAEQNNLSEKTVNVKFLKKVP